MAKSEVALGAMQSLGLLAAADTDENPITQIRKKPEI